ncbi:MAG: protein translocase subunit SecD [Vulcanimicrobiota bacterium]
MSYNSETKSFNVKLGLDLKSGSHISIKLIPVERVEDGKTKMVQINKEIVNQTITVLRRRLDPYGNKEIIIQPEGTDRLIIEIPEETDVNKAVSLIKQTAYLEFKEQMITKTDEGIKQEWNKVMDGTALKKSSVGILRTNQPIVEFELKNEYHDDFAKITERNKGKPLGIFLDGNLIDAPNVKDTIPTGSGMISGGGMTLEDCKRLSILLNAGALPVKIEVLESLTVSPLLGKISLMRSLGAMFIGMSLVMIFMAWYYKLPGFIANIALVSYTLALMASMVVGKFVLTLPGIAGFILSVGMAVDANVLVFERMKEELARDNALKTSIEKGFSKAFSSIIDGHVTTFLGALILYYLGSSTIKGFGLTLMLGVFWSVITAVFITRVLIDFTANHVQNKKMYGA